MKNVVFIFAMLCLQVGVTAQDSDVPANVEKALKAKYPSTEYVDWMTGDNYIANFWIGDLYLEATFDKTGKWLETSTVLEEADLPSVISEGITKSLGEHYITYIVKMDKNDGSSTYIVDVSTNDNNFQVTTDAKGNVLKKEVVEEEDDEDDGF